MKVTVKNEKPEQQKIKVGDLIKFSDGEIRYVIKLNGKYYTIDLKTGHYGASGDTLEELQSAYYGNGYVICKIDELVLEEI